MALHSVDRHGLDRGNPAPNTHDVAYTDAGVIVNSPRTAHGTNSINYVTAPSAESSSLPIKMGMARLVANGQITISINGSDTLSGNSIPHNLGYVPMALFFLNNATTTGVPERVSVPAPLALSQSISGGNIETQAYLDCYVSGTTVYGQIFSSLASPFSITMTYYLFQQSATG